MNDNFDIVNCKANLDSHDRLVRLLKSGSGVLFVGLGSSRRLNYPSWEGLLSDLSKNLLEPKDILVIQEKILNEEFLLAAEIIKNKSHSEKFEELFKKYFDYKVPAHDNFHRSLVKLKFKGFVTTNYDPVIESALRGIQPILDGCGVVISETTMSDVHRFIKSIATVDWNKRYLLYLHGKYNLASTTILSYRDYVKKYDGFDIKENSLYPELIAGNLTIDAFESKANERIKLRTHHYNTIYSILATQRMVYFGYGLRDPYLNKIIKDIQNDFQLEYDDYHFALISSNETIDWSDAKYRMVKEEWNIKGMELVIYKDNPNYTGIETFINDLPPECYIPSLMNILPQEEYILYENNKLKSFHESDISVNEQLKYSMNKVINELKNQ